MNKVKNILKGLTKNKRKKKIETVKVEKPKTVKVEKPKEVKAEFLHVPELDKPKPELIATLPEIRFGQLINDTDQNKIKEQLYLKTKHQGRRGRH